MKMDSTVDKIGDNHDPVISMLRSSHAAISPVLLSSIAAERDMADTDRRLLLRGRSLSAITGPATRLYSQAAASKALCERINRAVYPALSLVPSSPAESLAALRKVSEPEIGKMNYKGALAEALVGLQDEFKKMLRRLRHADIDEIADGGWKTDSEDPLGCRSEWRALGSIEEIDVLRRLSEILASNDCLDTCIDIFVKVRRRHVMKTFARLKESAHKYTSKDSDCKDCESLDPAIYLWTRYLRIVVTIILPAEKHLCRDVLSSAMNGSVWPECFNKISLRVMLVLFRFGEGVAISPNKPNKLIKLLKMTDTARCLRPAFSDLFNDCVPKIYVRARDLEKLLVDSAFRSFSALRLRIDGIQNDFLLPTDASVPNVVLYGVNFLKCLAADQYTQSLTHTLSNEAQPNQNKILKESFIDVLNTLQRNVEHIWEKFKDRKAAHVFAMNTNWFVYINTRGSELAILMGEEEMRRRYKGAAEAATYAYQEEAWEPMVRMLEKGEVGAFLRGMKDNLRRHRRGYVIQDADLREQIKETLMKMFVRAHERFIHDCSGMVQGIGFVTMEDIRVMLSWIFDDGSRKDGRRREKVVGDMMASLAVALPGRERRKGGKEVKINARLQFDS